MLRTLSRICGIMAPLAGTIFVWLAVANSPWFSWTEEDMSVLGVNGSATSFFNYGLGLTGLLGLAFATGLGTGILLRRRAEQLGILALILGSVALSLVGLVPRTYPLPHKLASGFFFALMPFGMFIIGIHFVKTRELFWAAFSLAAAALMVGLQLVPWPWRGSAIPQLLSAAPWALWVAALGLRFLLRPRVEYRAKEL